MRFKSVNALAVIFALVPLVASAQTTTTYHLHNEASLVNGANKQLKLAVPDTNQSVVLRTQNLKNFGGNVIALIANFETQSGVPGKAGTIASGSTVTFTLKMRVTALPNSGNLYPYAVLYLNSVAGQQLCIGGDPSSNPPPPVLTTTLTWYTLSCTTNGAITMSASDRFFLEVDARLAGVPGKNLYGELAIETNTDSIVIAPNPAANISSVTPGSGYVGQSVTIAGTGFGATQGASTVKFNGTTAAVTSWSSTSIAATIPTSATSGPVVVTVDSTPSNGVTFTVVPHISTLTPSTGPFAQAVTIAGTSFGATQGTSTITFNGATASATSWSATSISTAVPSGATTGPVVITVAGNASNGATFTVLVPTISSVNPAAAAKGESVTISGNYFGATQGASTVTFNGASATPTGWSNTSITVPVPLGATTGPVVVTVGGVASNGVTFTLITTGTLSGTISRTSNGSALSGATVQAVLAGVVKGSATSAANGTYSIANLDPGTYDVRVLATTYSSEVRSGTSVAANLTTTVNVAMSQPGAISGRVTQSDGVTPIGGAAVTVYAGPVAKGSTQTNGTGDYTISGLHPGGFTVQAASAGYVTSEQGATVTENATTTKNVSLETAPAGSVQYAYDELGRLVQVTDPAGQVAIYRYDAVGNILAIERPGASGIAISGFTPNSGTTGTTVIVYGAGFSTTASENTVTFHGTIATVTTATPTQIEVTVPSGATTGTIAVTTPTGSATSGAAFTVLAGSGVPTISGFTPAMAAAGTALTVNGSNFETVASNNNLRVNISLTTVSSATPTSLQTTLPPTATTGRVSVATPNGTATSTDYLWVAPVPYVVADVESTAMLPVATPTSVVVNTANKIALLAFDGVAGERTAISVYNTTGSFPHVYLYSPLGTVMRDILSDGLLEPVDLLWTGTYTVVFDPNGTVVTGGTLLRHNVPPDFSGTITPGSEVAVTLSAGQNGRLTFTGTAQQRISLNSVGGTIAFQVLGCDVYVSILKPDNSTLVPGTCMEQSGFIDTTTLPVAGTYTIVIDPASWAAGTQPLRLYTVTDFSGTVTPTQAGSLANVVIDTPGQNGGVTFTGAAQQRVSISTINATIWAQVIGCDVNVSVINTADNSVVVPPTCMELEGFIEPFTLPAAGTYKIVVDPVSFAIGNEPLTVYDVPPDVTGSVTINGSALPVQIVAAGQNADLSFSGTAGQSIRAPVGTPGSSSCATLKLLRADNTTEVTSYFSCGATITLPSTTLPGTGTETYHLRLDLAGTRTGNYSVSVVSP
jgi:YD repeat-containing protein